MYPIGLEKHRCYFLGTYQNQWINRYNGMASSEAGALEPSFSMTNEIQIPNFPITEEEKTHAAYLDDHFGKQNVNIYLTAQRMNEPERQAFWQEPQGVLYDIDKSIDGIISPGNKHLELEYLALRRYMLDRKEAFDACKAINYPPPPKTPQYSIPNAPPEQTWPGIPMSELTPPAPETPPAPAPGAAVKKIFLQLGMAINYASQDNQLVLHVLFSDTEL